jgi:PAS domain S-box-containing protein
VFSIRQQTGFAPRPVRLAKFAAPLWVLVACLTFLLAPTPARSQSTTPRLESVTLQLRWKHQFQFAGYYAAQIRDFYHDAGLDVQIVEAQDGQNPIETVIDGGAAYGVGNSELVLWRNQGKPVVVLGVIFQHSPLVLLSPQSSGIDTLHALVGRRVAIEQNSAELLAYLQDEGILEGDLQITDHHFDPSALISGEVDAMSAYSTDEPFLLQSAGVPYQVFSPRSAGIDFYGDVLFTTEEEIRQHPQRVQAFLDATMRGWKYAFEHQDELIDYIYTQLTQRHSREHLAFEAEQMRRLVLPDLIEPGYMYEGRWRSIAETYTRVGLLPESFPVANMLYHRALLPDFSPLYSVIGVALVVTLVGGLISLRFYRLNQRLRRENIERERAQTSLTESEERYRSLIETAPFPVVITRIADGIIRYINPRAEIQIKLRKEEAIGKRSVDYYVNPEDRRQMIERLHQTGHLQDNEVCLHDTLGQEFWASMSATIMTYEGQPCYFVTFTDITERRRAQQQAFTLAVEQERVKVLTHFIENASHEFRTPLSIIGSSIYLIVKGRDEDKRQRHADIAQIQIKQITHLVDMLTRMAMLDSGAPLRLAPLDLTTLLYQTAQQVGTDYKARQLTLTLDLPPESILVQADHEQLHIAFRHLLENAKRYTFPGGEITVTLQRREMEAITEVRDTGIGISAESLPHIFKRFWREDGAHSTPGFGLGLPLIQKIIVVHGGTITAESTPGSGSVFRVTLPLVKPPTSEVISPSPETA